MHLTSGILTLWCGCMLFGLLPVAGFSVLSPQWVSPTLPHVPVLHVCTISHPCKCFMLCFFYTHYWEHMDVTECKYNASPFTFLWYIVIMMWLWLLHCCFSFLSPQEVSPTIFPHSPMTCTVCSDPCLNACHVFSPHYYEHIEHDVYREWVILPNMHILWYCCDEVVVVLLFSA